MSSGLTAVRRIPPHRRWRVAGARLKRLAGAVRDGERLRGAVFRAAPDAIVISDAEGRVRQTNPAATTLFGRAEDALIGRLMCDLVEAEVPSTLSGNMLAALGRRVVLQGLKGDGSRFPAEITVQRVGSGRRTRYAAFIRDLTDTRQDEAEAEARHRHLAEIEKLSAMGSLLSGVAHELNNPLAIVAAQAMLLRERAADPDVARRAERINAAAQRAGRIVRSFTALATRRPAQREPLALAGAFAEARDLVGHRLRQAGISLEAAFPPDLPVAAGDPDLIIQVFVNLLLNAQEALTGQDGERRIAVQAAGEPSGVAVEIADNGPGVDAAVADRLFDPYVTTKPPGTGLGIGLSLCRSVLDQHGGTITFRSVPGSGATFRVVLPCFDTPAGPRPRVAPRPAPLRVLVVDDEVEVGRTLAELIEILGHTVDVVASAAAALDRLATSPCDAVFTDVHMPGIDGEALRGKIATSHPHLRGRTVLVTGEARPRGEEAADALRLGKPFTAEAVASVLSRLSAA